MDTEIRGSVGYFKAKDTDIETYYIFISDRNTLETTGLPTI